jgi:ABC-type nitrate/sulfonate/bicarbonate transport system substrate-binding protein
VSPADLVADQLAVCDGTGIVPTTPAEVLATLTAQADPARAALVAGLREAAAWIETHPEAPVPRMADLSIFPRGTDEEKWAEVDRVAAVLGVDTQEWSGGGQYVARRRFGPVTLEVIAHTLGHMARYQAETTYSGAVSP